MVKRKTKTAVPVKAEHEVSETFGVWYRERLDDRGSHAQRMAKDLGINLNVLFRMLKGERPLRLPEAVTFAKYANVTLTELARRYGCPVSSVTAPILSWLNQHGKLTLLPPDQVRQVEAPVTDGGAWNALEVRTNNTPLAIHNGTVMFFHPQNTVPVHAFGRLCVVEIADEPSPLVGIPDRASFGHASVRLFGTETVIETAKLVSASPIRWTRAG